MIATQGCKVNAIRHDVDQGTADWLELRKLHVTASDALIVMGMSPWRTRDQLLQEKLGLIPPQEVNSAMLRGQLLEPKARACAEEMLGTLFMPEVYSSIEYPFMLASLDGVCIDNKIILEVKCTNKKNHELAKNGKIPEYYMPQVQHQIAVCQVNCCNYFSFDGDSGVVVVVDRDDVFIERMIAMEWEFYQEMIV
jgi:putative phage-type endonuclease